MDAGRLADILCQNESHDGRGHQQDQNDPDNPVPEFHDVVESLRRTDFMLPTQFFRLCDFESYAGLQTNVARNACLRRCPTANRLRITGRGKDFDRKVREEEPRSAQRRTTTSKLYFAYFAAVLGELCGHELSVRATKYIDSFWSKALPCVPLCPLWLSCSV